MNDSGEMKVTYIDPDQRALFVAELPDGGYTAWVQRGKDAPRKLVSKGYIAPEGYASHNEAQKALALYVSNRRYNGGHGSWDVYVNGKCVTWDDLYAMNRGELAVPGALPPAAAVTLANIEYRISTHIQGAYENLLQVGHCLNEAKEAGLVPHGEWEAWVRRNAHMSERQAQKLMQAARSVLPGSAMERLPISKIQAILALPELEREPMAEQATEDSMSLRELQAAIAAKKQAEAAAKVLERRLEAAKKDASAYLEAKRGLERSEKDLRDQLSFRHHDIDRLKKELEEAKESAGSDGISDEAQAVIDRLKADLADAESYAEIQAEQRQQAQREMLAMQSEAARGEAVAATDVLTAFDLAAAVRVFIGAVGVLPHMGVALSQSGEGDRQQVRQHIDMVAAWVDGARQALGMIVVDA